MSDRYVPVGYTAPPGAPQMQQYAQPQQAPQQVLPPVPGYPPLSYTPVQSAAYVPQQLPYDPNASPTEPWPLEPVNVITPMDPNKGRTLDEIPAIQAWRGY